MSRFWRMIPICLGFVLIGANLWWAPVCQGHMQLMNGAEAPMKCFYTGKASIILSILLVVAGTEDILRKKSSSLIYIGIGIILFLLPNSSWGIGVCAKKTMACTTTAFWIQSAGIGSVLYGIIALYKKNDIVQVPE